MVNNLTMFLGGGKPGVSPSPVSISSYRRAANRHIIRNLGGTVNSSRKITPFRIVFNEAGTNPKHVSDNSDYIRYKKLQAIKRTYNSTKL